MSAHKHDPAVNRFVRESAWDMAAIAVVAFIAGAVSALLLGAMA